MRVLLSTIGSRGDVQPLVALASQLKALGQQVHLCVPPDFQEWIEGLGMPVTPIGPNLRQMMAAGALSRSSSPPSPEQRRQMIEGTVIAQFETIVAAADASACDIIVAATALQIAARSVAEKRDIPYIFVAYCPNVLPSAHHAPPPHFPGQAAAPATLSTHDHRALWDQNAAQLNAMWGDLLNAQRAALGLAPVSDVRSHIFTDRPWLAADPVLAPWPAAEPRAEWEQSVCQTGAWILQDDRPLARELETFLDRGDPPIYSGFGSMRAPQDLSQVLIHTARALGRRAIVSKGWADLSLVDEAPDCLAIGEVNQQALFPRVAAIVHHGGAGTTTAAALAGSPQVIIPQIYDQHYFAERVQDLGIGTAHAPGTPTVDSLTAALARTLDSGSRSGSGSGSGGDGDSNGNRNIAGRAHAVAAAMRRDGAQVSAQRVIIAGR
jgi:vancomycin aglycone glucosyltransferase